MTIAVFLEIIIGVIFVWFFLALAVMAIQEWWAGFSKTRATDLQKAIRAMLEDPKQYNEAQVEINSIVGQLYQHPLIESLSEPLRNQKKPPAWRASRTIQHEQGETPIQRWLPSYIPTRTFALALFDVITTAGTEDSVIRETLDSWQTTAQASLESLSREGKLPNHLKPKLDAAIAELRAAAQSHIKEAELPANLQLKVAQLKTKTPELTTALNELKPIIDQLPQYLSSQKVVKGVAQLAEKHPAAGKTLAEMQKRAFGTAAQGEDAIAAFRTNIETWFDDTMGRASEWYRQKARILSFVFGVVVAIVLNVDSLAVATALYKQPVLRAQVLAQAETVAQEPETGVSPDKVGVTLQDLGLPVGWSFLDKTACAAVPVGNRYFPLGTRCIVPGDTPKGIEASSVPEFLIFILLKLAGWTLSGAMAAQGAPFWFDMMKKLLNMRSGDTGSS